MCERDDLMRPVDDAVRFKNPSTNWEANAHCGDATRTVKKRMCELHTSAVCKKISAVRSMEICFAHLKIC